MRKVTTALAVSLSVSAQAGDIYSDGVAREIGTPGVETAISLPFSGQQGERAKYFLPPTVLEKIKELPPPRQDSSGRESVIGVDTRVQNYPDSSHATRASVLIVADGWRCSGWLYAHNQVATAAHCLHDGPGGSWATGVTVHPAFDGTGSSFPSCNAVWMAVPSAWVENGAEAADYGSIRLDCDVGFQTGWYGYQVLGWPVGAVAMVTGYPGEHPLTQWTGTDRARQATTTQAFYRADTSPGMSGSPVWHDRNGPVAYAIHAYGKHQGQYHSTLNHGTRIIQQVFNRLTSWKNLP